jgi:hypothetical protein
MAAPQHPDPNYRSPKYCIARTATRCWHCGQSTGVLALLLPEGHETLDPGSEEESNAWQPAGGNAFLFYIAYLPDGVRRRLFQLSSTIRAAHSDATANCYWANHCESCGSLLDDHELHCETAGAFMPCSEADAQKIVLLEVCEPFEALAAGYALEPEFVRFMRKT